MRRSGQRKARFATPTTDGDALRVGEFQAFQLALALRDAGEELRHQLRQVFRRGHGHALRIVGDAEHRAFEIAQLQPHQPLCAGSQCEVLAFRRFQPVAAIGRRHGEQRRGEHHGQHETEAQHGRGGLRAAAGRAVGFGCGHRAIGAPAAVRRSVLFSAWGGDKVVSA